MPIRPGGALLTLTYSSSSIPCYVNEVTRGFTIIDFDRNEFSNNRLRGAKNSLGGLPIIINNVANVPVQVNIACVGNDSRPLTPDDSNVASIKQRFNIKRYTVRSAPMDADACDQIYQIAQVHQKLLDQFQLYLEESSSMDLSYDFLVALQAQTFSYLTTTDLTMSGDCVKGTFTNMLITDFNYDTDIQVTQRDGSKLLLRSFTMTIENRVIVSRTSSS